jgi:pantetheine-phosphate adenylyltransferase
MFNTVILGGTFDHFHKGHEVFLDTAFKSGKKILIGLTTKAMLNKLIRKYIWPYEKRKKVVEKFVKKYKKEYEIFPIDNVFGPTIEKEDIDAIVATHETVHTCERINTIRKRRGMKQLEIIFVPWVFSEDGREISSSRIRKGEIDREGKVLVDYKITDRLREELRKPPKSIFEGYNSIVTKDLISFIKKNKFDHVICVGDHVSRDFLKYGFKPRNIIVDGKVNRKPIDFLEKITSHYSNKFNVKNPPGTIAKEVWGIIKKALQEESAVIVDGEEDLLAMPVVLLSENNSVVIYGQPGRGKVVIKVKDFKEKWRNRLSEFKISHR